MKTVKVIVIVTAETSITIGQFVPLVYGASEVILNKAAPRKVKIDVLNKIVVVPSAYSHKLTLVKHPNK